MIVVLDTDFHPTDGPCWEVCGQAPRAFGDSFLQRQSRLAPQGTSSAGGKQPFWCGE